MQEISDAIAAAADDVDRGAGELAELSAPDGRPTPARIARFSAALASLQQRLNEIKTLQAQVAR